VCWCISPDKKAVLRSIKIVLTREQMIFIVKHYFRNESYALCQETFLNYMVPNKITIITKSEETASVRYRKYNSSSSGTEYGERSDCIQENGGHFQHFL
jgi:predicted nucleotidyltransferase